MKTVNLLINLGEYASTIKIRSYDLALVKISRNEIIVNGTILEFEKDFIELEEGE
jgi:hypothetical protein